MILDGIEQENHEKASAYKDGVHDEVFEGQHRKVTIKSVGYTGWKIVGVVSDKAAQLSTVKILFPDRACHVFYVNLVNYQLLYIKESDNPNRASGRRCEADCGGGFGNNDRGARSI